MKNIIKISGIVLLILLIHSCKKNDDNSIKDGDGNVYTSVTIGTQVWMVENLKTTKYKDGTNIPLETDNNAWTTLTSPAYCTYNGSFLYNWFATNNDKLCPVGWHVSSDSDWKILEQYIGLSQQEADTIAWRGNIATLLKSQIGWDILDSASNKYSFTALPSGFRSGWYGDCANFGAGAYWWTSTIFDSETAYCRSLFNFNNGIYRNLAVWQSGFSVRCLRDE